MSATWEGEVRPICPSSPPFNMDILKFKQGPASFL